MCLLTVHNCKYSSLQITENFTDFSATKYCTMFLQLVETFPVVILTVFSFQMKISFLNFYANDVLFHFKDLKQV